MPHAILTASGSVSGGVWVPSRSPRITASLYDGELLIDRLTFDPASERSRKPLLARGYEVGALVRAADTARSTGAPQTLHPTPPPEATQHGAPGALTIRVLRGPDTGTSPSSLPDALRLDAESILAWDDMGACCALDIDYHDTPPPPAHHLRDWVETRVVPRPAYWKYSRSGGLHLFYLASHPYTAAELAALAALRYRTLDRAAGVERKRQIRAAGGAPVYGNGAQDTTAALSLWVGDSSTPEDAIAQWLETQDMVPGNRYPHDRCPIEPNDTAGNDPVVVSEAGVYCHRCAGKGKHYGSRTPGFAPWSVLCGGTGSGDVGLMLRARTHWGHARWVLLHKYGLPEDIARDAYAAALRATHPELEEATQGVFHPDSAGLVRGTGHLWVNPESSYVYPTNAIAPILGTLPCATVQTEKGPRPVPSTVAYLAQGHDLTDRGYPEVRRVNGFTLASRFLPPGPATCAPVIDPALRHTPRAPSYLAPAARLSPEAADAVFAARFPGVDMALVKSLVAASGCAQETRYGLHPLLYVAGPSGSAKTSHVSIAAGVLGTSAAECTYDANEEKFKQSIAAASGTGAFAMCNEFAKESTRKRRGGGSGDPREAFESFLTLNSNTLCHVLYVGQRPLGKLPVIVVTEPEPPYALREYVQIARRMRFRQLHGAKSAWKQAFADLGVSSESLHLYRLKDAELSHAADSVLSDVIDTYFAMPMTWDAIADSLGCHTLLDSPEFEDVTPAMRRFFDLVCRCPGLQDDRLLKNYPANYRRISRTEPATGVAQELADLYQMLADPGRWSSSKLLTERDWSGILNTPLPVQLDLLRCSSGTAVYVRFRVGPPKRPRLVNGEILCATPVTTITPSGLA